MTDSEWQEIVRLVTETASQTAREYITSAYRKEPSAPNIPDSTRQHQIEIIRSGLERYRESDPDSTIRKMIDWLLRLHASLANPQRQVLPDTAQYTGSEIHSEPAHERQRD